MRHEWWATLAVAAAALSLAAVLPWWDTVSDGARFGAVMVDLIALAGLLPWRDELLAALR